MEKLLEWKRKSLFYMGKAELKIKCFDDAVMHLESALALTPAKAKDATVLKDLLETAKKYRAAELKKEKNTWSKAFKSSKAEHEAEEAAAAAAAAASATSKKHGRGSTPNGAESKVTVSKEGDKVNIDMNSILGKPSKTDKPSEALAKRDDAFFNMIFGLGFLGVMGGVLWAYRLRFWRR
jgi:cobalamin biosynthesis Mg chelatase CobN